MPNLRQPTNYSSETSRHVVASLEDIDNRSPSLWNWYTVRTLITSSAGFFTDAYDIFIINLVTPMLGYIYFAQNGNNIPPGVEGVVKGMTSFGTLVGQLLFGYMGDALGRKKVYGFELIIIIISTINCATSASTVRGVGVLGFLSFWRFFLGIGIGGDYPMSATITSEWTSVGRRGQMMALIFSMQGIGNLAAGLVTIVLLAIFKSAIETDVNNLEYVWRLCFGLGAVPAAATVYFRLTMPESPRYALDVEGDVEKAAKARQANPLEPESALAEPDSVPKSKEVKKRHHQVFIQYFSQWKHLKVLLGTALSWFFLDIAFYGLNLNNSYILSAIGFSSKSSPYDTLWSNAVGNIIISCLGFVPGYYFTVFTIERIGRKKIQLGGFIILTALFIVLSAAFNQLKQIMPLFIALFTLAQFFFNFGPNSTTFVIPGEVFPTKVRASAHGISAAAGKGEDARLANCFYRTIHFLTLFPVVGSQIESATPIHRFVKPLIAFTSSSSAIISTFGFNSLVEINDTYPNQQAFLPGVLGILAGVMFLGVLSTLLVPESKGRDLHEFEEGYLPHTREDGATMEQTTPGDRVTKDQIRSERPNDETNGNPIY
ncbi:major facilitator superfamily domain-containing protein [Endogone sp. FLAS-F59071]|nr:major facilitator superfamily domain-containing protein [Endogone sp. FLAS-F59071]|eukprot:RUS18159.1 major facilitator superfamily domain-containing protein [Endogone sp. FLAS-F59071]